MSRAGTKNHSWTSPEGITWKVENETKLMYVPKTRSEADKLFKRIITPIINQHLSTIANDNIRIMKREFFNAYFRRFMPS